MENPILLQNRYRVIRKLGQGGMGAVYLCIDNRLGCKVALKRMLCESEFGVKRFEREAMLLANLQHPVLPKVMDFFMESGDYFLVMEY